MQRTDQPRIRRPSSRKIPLKFISSACGLVALAKASFSSNFAFLHQLEERLVEIQHAVFDAGFNGGGQLVEAVFFNQLFDRRCVDHDFQRRGHAAADGGHHALANDGLQHAAELATNLLAFVGLEEIQNTADGLRGVGGVQCGQHQMAGIRRAHGGGETDGVTHFADHDDVRILAQNVFERVVKGLRVEPDFALFDDRLVVFKHVFDGIFQRDDVFSKVGVDMFDHRGQRGGFARSRLSRRRSTMPRGDSAIFFRMGSKPSSSKLGTLVLT